MPQASAPVDLDAAAEQAVSAGGDACKPEKGLIAANDFLDDLYRVIGGRGRLVLSLGGTRRPNGEQRGHAERRAPEQLPPARGGAVRI
jgi:hypothetical protein